jgi:hypothetical protein
MNPASPLRTLPGVILKSTKTENRFNWNASIKSQLITKEPQGMDIDQPKFVIYLEFLNTESPDLAFLKPSLFQFLDNMAPFSYDIMVTAFLPCSRWPLKTPSSNEISQFSLQAEFLILLAGHAAAVCSQNRESLQAQTPGEDSFLFGTLSPLRPFCGRVRPSL